MSAEFVPEQALLAEHSKRQMLRILEWVDGDGRRFGRLVGLMTGGDPLLEQRAAWVVGDCVERWPGLADPWLRHLLDNLARPGLHDAVLRATFRLLQFAAIPPDLEGRACELAMAALGGAAPVAVKAYSMTVLRRLVGRYPELLDEVRALIDEQLPAASPGFRARARREFGM